MAANKFGSQAVIAAIDAKSKEDAPASLILTKFTPLTTLPSFISRHGIMRLASILSPVYTNLHLQLSMKKNRLSFEKLLGKYLLLFLFLLQNL